MIPTWQLYPGAIMDPSFAVLHTAISKISAKLGIESGDKAMN